MRGVVRCLAALVVILVGIVSAGCAATPSNSTESAAPPSVVLSTDAITVERIAYPTRGPADPDQNWGDLYLPAGPQEVDTIPLVVLIHGGSWKSGSDAQTLRSYAWDLAERGMAVYNIEYRRVGSGGGWPTTFFDVADALDHVVALGEQYPQISTDDELVVGYSAGAQLATWSGTRRDKPGEVTSGPKFRPTRVVSLAGPLDMVYAAEHGNDRIVTVLGGTPDQVPDRYAAVDPIQNIDPTMPVVAIHGDQDTLVPAVLSQRYIAEVKRRNGIGDLVIVRGEDHGSLINPSSPAHEQILDIITDSSQTSIDELADRYGG